MSSKIDIVWSAISDRLATIIGLNQPLGCIMEDDFKLDVLSDVIPTYPAVFITTPAFTSQVDSSQENLRIYDFQLFFIVRGDNDVNAKSVAILQETISDLFDTDVTLSEKTDQSAVVFTLPAASQALTINTQDKTFIVFTITIKARLIVANA